MTHIQEKGGEEEKRKWKHTCKRDMEKCGDKDRGRIGQDKVEGDVQTMPIMR